MNETFSKWVACWGTATSITCLSWPEYLMQKLNEKGITNLSVIRRAVCGTRILRQYDCATLLPIFGWRTYSEEKEKVREEFNNWIRTSKIFDGYVDFDKAVRDRENPKAFGYGFDSGDHLHPSEEACKAMAEEVYAEFYLSL